MPTPPEPKRNRDINSLWEPFRKKVILLLQALEKRGYDPVIFEALRSVDRQKWLFGVGRFHSLKRKPVTWTMKSRHLAGKGVDIISKSKGWNYPAFFDALEDEARRLNLEVLAIEQCHVQWKG